MKAPIVRYVNLIRRICTVILAVLFVCTMISLLFAFNRYIGFMILAPVFFILFLALYGVYAVKIGLNTVIGLEVTEEVIHVKTRRKTFTFDAGSCSGVKETDRKFVCTFLSEGASDSFTFLRRVPFAKAGEEGFTEEDIRLVYPGFVSAAPAASEMNKHLINSHKK